MTKEEFKKRAKVIYNLYNGKAGEEGHMEIDSLMYDCLKELGYNEGLDILFSMDYIWYA